jgi:hypothetical protein
MGLIKQETAALVWECYREIEMGEKLLSDLRLMRKEEPFDKDKQKLRDAFGRRRNLQLGVPNGENCHRLFDVSPTLAESIIITHIENKRAELVEVNERAKIELNGN